MATVVQLPPDPNTEVLSKGFAGLGAGMAQKIMRDRENERMMGIVQKAQEDILAAPDSETAHKIAAKLPFTSFQQMNQVADWIRKVKPDTVETEETLYEPVDKNSGVYVQHAKGDVETRPTGFMTKAEIDREQQARTELRLEQDRKETESNQDLARNKMYNYTLGQMLDVKKSIGANGELVLDFEGDKVKAEAYRKGLTLYKEYTKKYDDPNIAAYNALKDSKAFEVQSRPAPIVEVPKPGFWEKAVDKIGGLVTPPATSAAAAAPTTAPVNTSAAVSAVPTRPTNIPSDAKYSPSQKSWWWRDTKGNWQSSKGK